MGNWYPGIYKMGWPAGISASWAPPGTFSRCDRALGRHSAMTAARSLARADSCTVSRHLCHRPLGNMNLGAYSYGKWELKPECDALSVFKYFEELQGQRSVGRFTTEINLVHPQMGSATKGSYSYVNYAKLEAKKRSLSKSWLGTT